MCWSCNPICGRCKPPRKRMVTCPSCGAMTPFEPADAISRKRFACPKCGADVTEQVHVDPVLCKRCDDWCAYPCKIYGEVPIGGVSSCNYRTPLTER